MTSPCLCRCLALLALLAAAPCAAAGVLQNGDFATEAQAGAMAPGWEIEDAHRALYAHVNDDGYSESHSLQYRADEEVPAGPVVQDFACEANQEYVLTAAMKSDGATAPMVEVVVPGEKPLRVVALTSKREKVWIVYSARFNSGGMKGLQVRVFGDRGIPRSERATVGRSGVDDVQVYLASEAPEEVRPRGLFTAPGPNIALGKPYTLHPRPNYGYSTDPDDATQLTDGEHSVGYFWVQKTTVGWSNASPVVITIDFGEVKAIAGVSYNTAAGVAGVSWPQSIGILVSDDKQEWTFAGDLISLATKTVAPPTDRYSQHRFATDALKTRGRYLSLIVDSSPYCFVDEVEVYAGPDELLAAAPSGPKMTDPAAYVMGRRILTAILWRLTGDLQAAREAIEDATLPDEQREQLQARVAALAAEIEALPEEVPDDFQAILPFSELHASIYALNAPLLRARGLPSLSVWRRHRYDMLAPTDAPDADELTAEVALKLDLMNNEYRADAFNLTNATDEELALLLTLDGLPQLAEQDYVSVREVLFTDTKPRVPIAAALPEAKRTDGGWKITIPSGCTRQVWLSFHPQDLAPGEYDGRVTVADAQGAVTARLPIRMNVYPFTFPDETTIAVGGWDYTDGKGAYDATPENIPALIANLREHWVNTPWATRGVMPQGDAYDEQGGLTTEPTFDRWDEWVARWPEAKHYCVFMAVGGAFRSEKMGTDRFSRMVGEYMGAWVEHIRGQGIDPNKLAVLLVDEPHRDEQVQTIITWARAIRAAAPEVVIWEDPTYRDPRKANVAMFDLLDVMCPNLPMFMGGAEKARQFYVDQQAQGRDLWFYSCSGPNKLLDPCNYFRGQFWWAVAYGAKGSCYWAFADEARSGNSFNAYKLTRSQYSPLFITPTSVTDGKHMEAIREGAQDYEYFVMLRERVNDLKAKGVSSPALEGAEELLEDGPREVISEISPGSLSWRSPTDRGRMDRVRIEVLEALKALGGF